MKKRVKRFSRLQAELTAYGLDRDYIAKLLGHRGRAYVDRRMCGICPWDLADMDKLMDLIHWPREKMHELFPRDGLKDETA